MSRGGKNEVGQEHKGDNKLETNPCVTQVADRRTWSKLYIWAYTAYAACHASRSTHFGTSQLRTHDGAWRPAALVLNRLRCVNRAPRHR